jgi:hypothetical protein
MRLAASDRAKTNCKIGPDSPLPICDDYRVGETAGSKWEWKGIRAALAAAHRKLEQMGQVKNGLGNSNF